MACKQSVAQGEAASRARLLVQLAQKRILIQSIRARAERRGQHRLIRRENLIRRSLTSETQTAGDRRKVAIHQRAQQRILPFNRRHRIWRRHIHRHRHRLPLPKALIARKEERAVTPHRTAHRAAKIVLRKSRLGRLKRIARIQGAVAQELKQRAMKRVGAGLRHYVDRRARRPAKLRRRVRRHHADLFHGVHADAVDTRRAAREHRGRRGARARGHHGVIGVTAVKQEIIVPAARAIHIHAGALNAGAIAAAAQQTLAGDNRHAWLKIDQLSEVAPVQRQVEHAPPVHQTRQRRVRSLQRHRPVDHRNGQGLRRNHFKIHRQSLLHRQIKLDLRQLMARMFGHQRVAADAQARNHVLPLRTGNALPHRSRSQMRDASHRAAQCLAI